MASYRACFTEGLRFRSGRGQGAAPILSEALCIGAMRGGSGRAQPCPLGVEMIGLRIVEIEGDGALGFDPVLPEEAHGDQRLIGQMGQHIGVAAQVLDMGDGGPDTAPIGNLQMFGPDAPI